MPIVKKIDSIKICVYSRDHLPPHFHVLYAEYEALIEIKSLNIIAGKIPAKVLQKVNKWAAKNTQMLLENFFTLNPNYAKNK